MTVNELEMTELLLGDVTMQKDRIAEEHDLMSRAWEISEDDLVMGDVIGMGGMGVSRIPHFYICENVPLLGRRAGVFSRKISR